MHRIILRTPSPAAVAMLALVVAMLALVVALSGSAVALKGRNKVDHNDLRKHVVHAGKIHPGAVKTAKLSDAAVTTVKLADGAITNLKIADGHISAAKIASGAVTSSKIASFAVTSSKIGSSAVTNSKIASSAVTASRLASGAVTVSKLDAVTGVVSVNFGSIAAHTCDTLTPVASGVTTSDNIILTPDVSVTGSLIWGVRQPGFDDFLWLDVCNPTAGAIDPPLSSFRYLAIHP